MIYDSLVHERLGCVQAIVRCSNQMGLIGENKLSNLTLPIETPDCGSLFAAKRVLKQCLSERGYCLNNGDKELADKLWADVVDAVEQYKKDTSLVHERKPGTTAPLVECSHMAPIVMDFLLQKLEPYL